MSLYEAVDYEMLQTSAQPSPVESQGKYEPLRMDKEKQNNYQQLNNHTRRSDLNKELQILRRDVRCAKIALSVGFVVVVSLAIATTVAIALSMQANGKYQGTPKLNRSTNGLTSNKTITTVTSFQKCMIDARSCVLTDFSHKCHTATLLINKTVSHNFILH